MCACVCVCVRACVSVCVCVCVCACRVLTCCQVKVEEIVKVGHPACLPSRRDFWKPPSLKAIVECWSQIVEVIEGSNVRVPESTREPPSLKVANLLKSTCTCKL